jgi:hypothetical protein
VAASSNTLTSLGSLKAPGDVDEMVARVKQGDCCNALGLSVCWVTVTSQALRIGVSQWFNRPYQ